jgi:hypothetical protein
MSVKQGVANNQTENKSVANCQIPRIIFISLWACFSLGGDVFM